MASSTTFPLYKTFGTVSITIPNDGAVHQILPLMQAVDPQAPIRGKWVNIQNDPLISTANCYLGEGPTTDQGASNPAVVSATNRSVIPQGASENFGGFWDSYNQLQRYFVINSGDGTGVLKLNITVSRG